MSAEVVRYARDALAGTISRLLDAHGMARPDIDQGQPSRRAIVHLKDLDGGKIEVTVRDNETRYLIPFVITIRRHKA